jgi:hypothetical protein
MTDLFSFFYVEQATPDEVVVFLVLGGLAALVVAFTLYALILVVLWRWRMEGKGKLRAILLPSRKRLKANLGEYALATITALLLTFSVAARHDVVKSVLDQPVEDVDHAALRAVLHMDSVSPAPFLKSGATAEQARAFAGKLEGRELVDAERELLRQISVRDFVVPMLRAGLPENASRLLLTSSLVLQGRTRKVPTRAHLLFAAAALLIFFVAWSGWRRIRELQVAESEPDWSALAKRLSVPALCVPLLLVSAAAADNPERISRAAQSLAVIEASDSAASPRTPWIDQFVLGDVAAARMSPERVTRRIGEVSEGLRSHGADLESLNARLFETSSRLIEADSVARDIERRLALLHQRLTNDSLVSARGRDVADARTRALEGRISALSRLDTIAAEARLARDDARRALAHSAAFADSVRALRLAVSREISMMQARLPSRALVFIVGIGAAGDYDVSGTNDAGVGTGLHELAPGSYTVTGNGANPARVTVAAGRAYTVRLTPAAPIIR